MIKLSMHRPNSYIPFIITLVGYVAGLVILDTISDSLGWPTVVIVLLILLGQLLFIVTAPKRHLRALSILLLIVSILGAPVLYFALQLAVEGFSSPELNVEQRLSILSSLLVPIFGAAQFIALKMWRAF